MNGFNFSRLPRILLTLGVMTVAGLWIAEEVGLLEVAEPADARSADLPLATPLPVRVVLQGVIAGDRNTPGVAILAEAGRRPVLVPEGAAFSEDLRVERVMPDRVVLRQRSSGAPIVLPLSLMPGDVPISPGMEMGRATDPQWRDEIPPPPPLERTPSAAFEPLPTDRVAPAVDASGPPPGSALTGPALPGPAAGR